LNPEEFKLVAKKLLHEGIQMPAVWTDKQKKFLMQLFGKKLIPDLSEWDDLDVELPNFDTIPTKN